MNEQPPEQLVKGDGSSLDVHSVFLTLQGEGPFTGRRAVFVRLAGCNLQCPGCDTLYTKGRETINAMTLVQVALAKVDGGNPLIVITGGEPLRQPIGLFVELLLQRGCTVQIESNGVCPPDERLERLFGVVDNHRLCLVVSPKTPKLHPRVVLHIAAYKYVIDARSQSTLDGLPLQALELDTGAPVARPFEGSKTPVYITPYDDRNGWRYNNKNKAAVARAALRHGYVAGVQLHKLLGLD